MRYPKHLRPCGLALLVITTIGFAIGLTSCGQTRQWEELTPEERMTISLEKRVVLFAPVTLGPLAGIDPEARNRFANDLAAKLSSAVTDAKAWASATLPESGSSAWTEGPVGAAAGAEVVVLTEVLDLERKANAGVGDGRVSVTVRTQALGINGRALYSATTSDWVADKTSPKLMADGAQPASRAAWGACKQGLTGLSDWLNQAPGPVMPTTVAVDGPSIAVSVNSIPKGADIMIDGAFLGNTPMIINLPVEEVTVTLQMQGYHDWQKTLTASPGMTIQPALTPQGGAAPATGDK